MKFKSGDTLSEIASKHKTTIAKMLAANPNIKSANSIQAGQSYNLPPELSKNSGKYTGRHELNPYKGTDKKALDADQASRSASKNKNNKVNTSNSLAVKAAKESMAKKKNIKSNKTLTSKNTFSNDQDIKGKNKMVSKNTNQGIDEAKGDNTKAKKKKSFGSSVMSFLKGEGKKITSGFNKAVTETKRNAGPGRNTLASKGTSNINNSSTYKKKVDKKNSLAMQKKQQSKKLKNQMST